MLTLSAAALLAAAVGAAAAKEPITGAFGLEFAEPVPEAVLGASLGVPPHPVPPGNLEQTVPEPVPDAAPSWHLFIPQARPPLLESPDVTFSVLLDASGHPVRILAEHPEPDCAEDLLWLTRSLAKKYRTEDDPYGAERSGFRHSARFVSGEAQIDLSCGPTLLIEYTDGQGYRRWLGEEQARLAAHRQAQEALARERARLEEARLRRLAESITDGDRFRVDAAFGVAFGEPVNTEWIQGEADVDTPLPARLPDLEPPFDLGDFTVTVGPDLRPVRVTGELADPGGVLFQRLAAALRIKYGPPAKDGDGHKIHKVAGDYLVVRRVPEDGRLRLVFIDDEGRRAQRAREVAAHQARLAEQQRLFEEETAGL